MKKKAFLLCTFLLVSISIGNYCPVLAAENSNDEAATTSPSVDKSVNNYLQSPGPESFRGFIRAFKAFLSTQGKSPASTIFASNPSLSQLGTKVIDISGGKLWIFSKVPNNNEAVVQWMESKSHIVKVKRRKKAVVEQVSRLESIVLPAACVAREGKLVNGKDSPKVLVIAGDKANGAIWLKAYRQVEGHFVEASQFFSSVPPFLLDDVSGWVSFHGSDLVFTVSPLTDQTIKDGNMVLPESERSTYKFCLRISESGYILESGIEDLAPYSVLSQFLQNIKQGKLDASKAFLADTKLISIPKYIGLNGGHTANFKVTQMAAAPAGIYRFRLLTGLKDDLIFDIASVKIAVKNEPVRCDWLIKAIFIAPTDKFLQKIANNLPTVEQVHDIANPCTQAVSAKTIRIQP